MSPAWHYFAPDRINLPAVGTQPQRWGCAGDQLISLFAAYCTEFGGQSEPWRRNHSPYAVFRRARDAISTEIVGVEHRPWLDARWWFDATRDEDERDPGLPNNDAYLASEDWLREPIDLDSLRWTGRD